jgi:hypothetical protein
MSRDGSTACPAKAGRAASPEGWSRGQAQERSSICPRRKCLSRWKTFAGSTSARFTRRLTRSWSGSSATVSTPYPQELRRGLDAALASVVKTLTDKNQGLAVYRGSPE